MSGNVCPLRRTPPTSLPVPQPLSCHQAYGFHLCSLSGSKSHMSTWCEPWEGPQTEASHRWGNWSPQTSRAAPWTEYSESSFLHCKKRVLSEALRLSWAGPERLCYCVFPLPHGTKSSSFASLPPGPGPVTCAQCSCALAPLLGLLLLPHSRPAQQHPPSVLGEPPLGLPGSTLSPGRSSYTSLPDTTVLKQCWDQVTVIS